MAQLQGAPLQQMAQQLGTSTSQTENAVGAPPCHRCWAAWGAMRPSPQGAMDLFGVQPQRWCRSGRAAGLTAGRRRQQQAGGGPAGCWRPSWATFLAATSSALRPVWAKPPGWVPMPGSCCKCWHRIVMSFLAQRMNAGGMDAGSLGQVLNQEKERAQQQGGLGGGLLAACLTKTVTVRWG